MIARLSMCAGAVYPRWRGEHRSEGDRVARGPGLSPLARGTRGEFSRNARLSRFIPAGAGNTGSTRPRRAAAPVYPRWRGEHTLTLIYFCYCGGLSPLARGTRALRRCGGCLLRFIPAGAGNTNFPESWCWLISVYPRWRGEHTKDILLFYNSFLSTQQFTNFITTISHY